MQETMRERYEREQEEHPERFVRLIWEDDEIGHGVTVPIELVENEIAEIKAAEGTVWNYGNARNFRVSFGHLVQVDDYTLSVGAVVPAEAYLADPSAFEAYASILSPHVKHLEPLGADEG
jgi:hypothetical protein